MAETWAISTGGTPGVHGTKDWIGSVGLLAAELDQEVRDRFDYVKGIFSGSELQQIDMHGVETLALNASGRAHRLVGRIIEFTSGTHPLISSLQIETLAVTAGVAAVTTAANLYVQDEPAAVGANNYAIYSAGRLRVVKDVIVAGGVVINNTAAALSGTDKGLEILRNDLTAGNAYGIFSRPSSTGTQATSMVGVYSRADKTSGTTTKSIAFQAGNPTISAGSYGEYYGFLIDDVTASIALKWGFYATGAINSRLTAVGGKVFIGETIDTDITTGMCINQGGATDAFLTGKNSNVSHGMSTIAETDTFFLAKMASATDGGIRLEGISDGTVGVTIAATVTNDLATPAPGSAPTTLAAPIQLAARKKDTTGVQPIDNDDLLLGIYNNTNGIFYFNTSGRFFSTDGTAAIIDFDTHEDFGLLNTFQNEVSWRGRIPEAFADYVSYKREDLVDAGILLPGGKPGNQLINWTLVWMLLIGNARQEGLKLRELEAEVTKLKKMLPKEVN